MQKVPQGSDESVPQLFPVSPSKSVEESFRTRDGNQYEFHSYSSIIDIVYWFDSLLIFLSSLCIKMY